jgi:hypothetical protein
LNHSNISVQYSSDKSYIIETVKSDLYRRNEIIDTIIRDNIQTAPVTPNTYIDSSGNIYAVESYTYNVSANTSNYTRVFTKNTTCDILIVGGGGAGDRNIGSGGGGGAVLYSSNITIPSGSYPIKVGKGGINNNNGESSEAFGATCLGGGSTPYNGDWGVPTNGVAGGSGSGGSSGNGVNSTASGGTVGISTKGTLLSSGILYNGNIGGNGLKQSGNPVCSGGGGGASTPGSSSISVDYTTRQNWIDAGRPSKGGDGVAINITGKTYYWGAGGGGGSYSTHAGDGGLGGGGGGGATGRPVGLAGTDGINNGNNGSNAGSENGGNGAPNTGSGGGGGGFNSNLYTFNNAGNGGSGIVIIRYLLVPYSSYSSFLSEPTVSPSITSNLAIFTHSGGTENQTSHTIYFPENTVCDILMVGGGGAGGKDIGAGGGGGAVLYGTNISIASGSYIIKVGRGGTPGEVRGQSTEGFGATLLGGGCAGNTIWNHATLANSGGSGAGGKSVPDAASKNGGTVGSSTKGTILTTATLYNGNIGGTGITQVDAVQSSGGGGAGAVGGNGNGSGTKTGNGGAGILANITGVNYYWGGGGGGGGYKSTPTDGGRGGGGAGERNDGSGSLGFGTGGADAYNAPVNMNGGAGSGGGGGGSGFTTTTAGNGGSGIIIIKVITSLINYKYMFFNYKTPPNTYTLNFPIRTLASINNEGYKLFNGSYTLTLGTTLSTIESLQNQNLEYTRYYSSNISILYNSLNPTLDPIGAQWTYSSNNTNVYHMGSVGIGTTSPEYQLDVRGAIYSSVGGYTQTGSENWVVQSDRRIKENIVKASYEKCLDNVKKIELYNFNFKDNCVNTNDKNQLGFIAQEVQQVYPKAVEVGRMTLDNNQGINDLLTLNTTQIKYTLYGAVKNLIERVENIESRVEQIYNMTLSSNIKSSSSNISITFITPLTPNITTNTSNITANSSNITTNTSNITTNTSNITTNSSNITTNTSNITANTSNITTNTSNITTNTSNITTNTSNITTNTSNITTNTSNITINTSNITANTSNITTNSSNTDTSNIDTSNTDTSNIDTSNIDTSNIDTSNI